MNAQEIINRAKQEIGTMEVPANSNCVKYNTWYYGKKVSGSAYPWCCAFVSWVFRDTGLIPKTASCTNMFAQMKKKGQVVNNPQPGDLVFFNFNYVNKCTETMKHIGIVEKVNSDGSVTTIEGNTSTNGSQDNGGIVCRKTRKKYIQGYCRPNYGGKQSTITLIKKGDKGEQVKTLQNLLKKHHYVISVDGEFGPKTEKCVKDFQKKHKLEVDGVVGPLTYSALLK